MPVSVTVQKLEFGPRNVSFHLTGIGDGVAPSNETLVKKIDITQFQPVSKSPRFHRISGTVSYGVVTLWWDAQPPVRAAVLADQFCLDFDRIGGLTNNAGPTATGSILLSTAGFDLNSTYDILLELVK